MSQFEAGRPCSAPCNPRGEHQPDRRGREERRHEGEGTTSKMAPKEPGGGDPVEKEEDSSTDEPGKDSHWLYVIGPQQHRRPVPQIGDPQNDRE